MNWDIFLDPVNLRRIMIGDFPDGPLGGLAITVLIAIAAIACSSVLGLAFGLARSSRRWYLHWPATVLIEVLRGVPAVMVIFWIWFAPPYFGFEFDPVATVIIALSLFTSAYIAEIVRGGLESVSAGQNEAALTVGLSAFATMRYVILPQALRNMIPALTGRFMVTVKNTSLVFLIGLNDLTGVARLINVRELAPLEIYAIILLLYFLLNRIILIVSKRLERRLAWEGTRIKRRRPVSASRADD